MSKFKVPQRGDIVLVNLNPTQGHEQSGLRPVLVISHYEFNIKSGLAIICPITSKIRGNNLEVAIDGQQTSGVVLPHQVRTIDLNSRTAIGCDQASDPCLQEVITKLKLIIDEKDL